MVKFHVNTALILEDDVRFEPYFVYQVQRVFEETSNIFLDWDLMQVLIESFLIEPSLLHRNIDFHFFISKS